MPLPARPGRAATALLEDAAERADLSMRERLDRLRRSWRIMVQVAVAVAVAWTVAHDVVGHARPFFAPTAAIITLGVTIGQRGRRAVEIGTGVTVGIAVADVLAILIGTGTWQLVVIVLLAMGTAVFLGTGTILVTQAAASAVLVVTLQPPEETGISFARSLDAGIGAACALLVASLVFPTDPLRHVREAAEPVVAELAAVLDDVAAALDSRSHDAAEAALLRARAIDDDLGRFREALDVGREPNTTTVNRRATRTQIATYADASAQIDLAVRNVRVLARGARRSIETSEHVPPAIGDALRELAGAVRVLGRMLDDKALGLEVVDPAVKAAAHATLVLEDTANLSVSVLVSQIRSTAVDLLRGAGLELEEAQRLVREGVGP